jgi:hypothetical protein
MTPVAQMAGMRPAIYLPHSQVTVVEAQCIQQQVVQDPNPSLPAASIHQESGVHCYWYVVSVVVCINVVIDDERCILECTMRLGAYSLTQASLRPLQHLTSTQPDEAVNRWDLQGPACHGRAHASLSL